MKRYRERRKAAKARKKRMVVHRQLSRDVDGSRPVRKVAKGARAQASRRTTEGKFTKVIFNQIGWKECRRCAAMT